MYSLLFSEFYQMPSEKNRFKRTKEFVFLHETYVKYD